MMGTLGLATAATLGTGCWGSFSLTGKVYDWNGSFGSKWASWGVFLVFILLPVYGTLLFIDAIIFNTIEFFSGKNPIQRSADLGNGQRMVFTPVEGDPDAVDVEHHDGDKVVRAFRINKTRRGFKLRDGRGEQLQVEAQREQLALHDANGTQLATLDGRGHDLAATDIEDGGNPSDAVMAVLEGDSMGRMLAVADREQIGARV